MSSSLSASGKLPSGLKPLTDPTLRSRTVEQLKTLIVSGELPAGSRLTETAVASALGISRGPLREAIRELVDIGLVVSKPYKGLYIRELSRENLEEIYSLRTVLEQFAFRECWDKRTKESLQDLQQCNSALEEVIDKGEQPLLAIDLELELHSWCYELSGHQLLIQSWQRLLPNLQFYFAMHQQAHDRHGPLQHAHDRYIELASGDSLQAMLDHLEAHMRQGLDATMSFIESK